MSDTSSQVLDPKHPWLTDERELPSRMNWVQTLFNPTGKSPRLHFTRAWTVLFMLQLMIIVLPFSIALVLDMAGGDGGPVGEFGVFATPVVFVITTLISYIIHVRRLNDAGKSPLWGFLPLLPLILALVVFMWGIQQQSAQYDERFELRQQYLTDPDAFLAKRHADQQKEGRAQPGQGGGMSALSFEKPLPAKAETVLKAALPAIQMVMVSLSALVAVWSLLWVARVPYFGRYPGSEEPIEKRPYEA